MFCIKPYCSRAYSRTIFFAWAQLVYQTSLKLRLKLGLFVNKRTWMSFLSYRARVVHEWLGSFTTLSLSFIVLFYFLWRSEWALRTWLIVYFNMIDSLFHGFLFKKNVTTCKQGEPRAPNFLKFLYFPICHSMFTSIPLTKIPLGSVKIL